MRFSVSYWLINPTTYAYIEEDVPLEVLEDCQRVEEIKPKFLAFKGYNREEVHSFELKPRDEDERARDTRQ